MALSAVVVDNKELEVEKVVILPTSLSPGWFLALSSLQDRMNLTSNIQMEALSLLDAWNKQRDENLVFDGEFDMEMDSMDFLYSQIEARKYEQEMEMNK